MNPKSLIRTLTVRSVEEFAVKLGNLLESEKVQIKDIWPLTREQVTTGGDIVITLVVVETERPCAV